MRDKYRSAIYTFSKVQKKESTAIVEELKSKFENKLITKILAFENFRPSREQITNYYYSNPEKPFCESFINPKLKLLLSKFSNQVDKEKLKHLKTTS